MKEGKTRTNAKKRPNNNYHNHTSKGVKETPKVREVKATEVEDNFLDEDDGDKRLIVFIAIAILVIVGAIIGLLVGCQKEKTPEPEKPEDDIVVPDKKEDKKEDKQSYDYDYEKPLPVARKTTKKTKSTTKDETTTDDEEDSDGQGDGDEEETTTKHNVKFIINSTGNSEIVEVEDGKSAESYVPSGYKSCNYYSNEEMTTEYDFGAVSGDVNVYMSCEIIDYTIEYDVANDNPSSYNVEDPDTTLNGVTSETGVFDGWYTDSTAGTKITTLNKDIIGYATSDNVIKLFARFTSDQDGVVSADESEEGKVEEGEPSTTVVGEGTTDETGENEEGLEVVPEEETTPEEKATEPEEVVGEVKEEEKTIEEEPTAEEVVEEVTLPTEEDEEEEKVTEEPSVPETPSVPEEPTVPEVKEETVPEEKVEEKAPEVVVPKDEVTPKEEKEEVKKEEEPSTQVVTKEETVPEVKKEEPKKEEPKKEEVAPVHEEKVEEKTSEEETE